MRIAIATPLYPPDTAPAALYAKELAERLSHTNEVSVIAYSYLPEPIDGVHIVSVTKRLPLPVRLATYTASLLKEMRQADVVYVINGASVELPLLIASFVTRTPFLFIRADSNAFVRAEHSKILSLLQTKAIQKSRAHITSLPLPRPEILPLEAAPRRALITYEELWSEHISLLTNSHGK